MTPVGGTAKDLPFFSLLVAGGGAGLLYWIGTYPTDVIKSAMQSDEVEPSRRKYRGIYDCARQLYYNEGGIKRFYSGYTPCLMRAIPANATMLFVMDECRQILESYV